MSTQNNDILQTPSYIKSFEITAVKVFPFSRSLFIHKQGDQIGFIENYRIIPNVWATTFHCKFDKKWVGVLLGRVLANSSGHPVHKRSWFQKDVQDIGVSDRVTRLAEFTPKGRLFTLAIFLKITFAPFF
jgi:hypothetical protein